MKGKHYVNQSTCDQPVVTNEYCFDPKIAMSGDTVYATVVGYNVCNSWEVYILIFLILLI
jgi:hypothetical protein